MIIIAILFFVGFIYIMIKQTNRENNKATKELNRYLKDTK